jgi:FAD/FMN-containing dehydrogenase
MTGSPAGGLHQRLVGELDGEVAFDDYSRHLFSRDASMYAIRPLGVVFPRHAADVAAAVRSAREFAVPVVPRGAGTSLAGQTVGPGLVIDFSRHMDRILAIDPDARTALVEVGVVQEQLNTAAAPFGLMFGPDTSTGNRATLGGMIGNNSAGSGSVRYGMTIDHVRALDVVLSDGSFARLEAVDEEERARRSRRPTLEGRLYRELPEIVAAAERAITEDFPPYWRRAGGYRLDRLVGGAPFDLARFVVGSEGTLVVATSALVDLVPRPVVTAFAVGHFDSVAEAIAATPDALACDPRRSSSSTRPCWTCPGARGSTPSSRTACRVTRVRCSTSPSPATTSARSSGDSISSRVAGGSTAGLPHRTRGHRRSAGSPAQGAHLQSSAC